MKTMTRRGVLAAGALLGGAPCACLAGAAQGCCTIPEAKGEAIRIVPELVTIDLAKIPELSRTGGYVKVLDEAHKVRILVARPAHDRFVALDQKCTHGGGPLTYVHRYQQLYCTCWGHSKFALDGSVIRWPNKQKPVPIRAYQVERKGSVLEVRI